MESTENKNTRDVAVQEARECQEGIPCESREMRQEYVPAVDILDSEGETSLILDMPGVDFESVDITVEKNVLTIKGKPKEEMFDGKTLVYSEYGIGDFERSFTLSDDLDKEGISATMKDGVLQVKIPKSKPVAKKIAVRVS